MSSSGGLKIRLVATHEVHVFIDVRALSDPLYRVSITDALWEVERVTIAVGSSRTPALLVSSLNIRQGPHQAAPASLSTSLTPSCF
jgi:hypothetical protein